ncbi:MAG: hypothetical protein ACRC6R_07760 [Bacteroidales bacterium]
MIQTIITYLIVFIAFGIASRRVWISLFRAKSSDCEGCTGCDLKKEIIKNKAAKANCCTSPIKPIVPLKTEINNE